MIPLDDGPMIFWQHPVVSLSQVSNANKTEGVSRRASRLASNTRSLSGVSPEGRGARHSCRHERDVTYHRSSTTSGRHASALFYMWGGLFVNAARETQDCSSWYRDYRYFCSISDLSFIHFIIPHFLIFFLSYSIVLRFPSPPSSLFVSIQH